MADCPVCARQLPFARVLTLGQWRYQKCPFCGASIRIKWPGYTLLNFALVLGMLVVWRVIVVLAERVFFSGRMMPDWLDVAIGLPLSGVLLWLLVLNAQLESFP